MYLPMVTAILCISFYRFCLFYFMLTITKVKKKNISVYTSYNNINLALRKKKHKFRNLVCLCGSEKHNNSAGLDFHKSLFSLDNVLYVNSLKLLFI